MSHRVLERLHHRHPWKHSSAATPARTLFVVVLLFLASGTAPASAQQTPTADYEVVFAATWSDATHPIDFPPSPHFSGLIGGTHNGFISFWNVGSAASLGIKRMAELGSKTPLSDTVNAAIGAGTADVLLSGGGIGVSPGSVSINFTAHEDYPLMTLVAMLAPSPDWFVGVSSLNLVQGGKWVREIVVPLDVYDAGTDSGVTFTSPDLVTTPPVPIFHFNTGPFAPPMQHVGTFTITRTSTLPPAQLMPTLSVGALATLAGSIALVGFATQRSRRSAG
jgi:hypothetical protein